MPALDTLLVGLLAAGLAVAGVLLWHGLRRAGTSVAVRELGQGHFAAALAAARLPGPAGTAGREELFTAAQAAKHLLQLERARDLLDRLLAADPEDGEARLESGLVAAYGGDFAAAEDALRRAAARRADLSESITLHRAWVALRAGDPPRSRRLFDEIEAALETKLRTDLGEGEPLFAEWFLQAAALWEAAGDSARSAWARSAGRAAAPESRVWERT